MGFPRQKSWSRLSFPSPGDLSDPGIKPTSPTLVGRFLTSDNSLYHHKNHIGTNMVKKNKTKQNKNKNPPNFHQNVQNYILAHDG